MCRQLQHVHATAANCGRGAGGLRQWPTEPLESGARAHHAPAAYRRGSIPLGPGREDEDSGQEARRRHMAHGCPFVYPPLKLSPQLRGDLLS